VSQQRKPLGDETLLASEYFVELERAAVRLDEEAYGEARARLFALGWYVEQEKFPEFQTAPQVYYQPMDPRPLVRIWGFAPLAGLTIKDFCERMQAGNVPVPCRYDELGPAWDRGVVDRWIKRKGLDR